MNRPDRCTACGSLDIVVIVDGEDDYIECSACGTTFDEVTALVARKPKVTLEDVEARLWRRFARDMHAHIERLYAERPPKDWQTAQGVVYCRKCGCAKGVCNCHKGPL